MRIQPHKMLYRKLVIGAQHFSDRLDGFIDMRSELLPPKPLIGKYGGGPYHDIGLEFFRYLLDFCALRRDSAVLDVGCGVGRIAYPLLAYFTPEARYEGFDIIPEGIEFCANRWTPKHPNFHFHLADVYNSWYNSRGMTQPEDYRFPYEDNSFDIVFSTSVMTHLIPKVIRNYVKETARVLKPDGRVMHTFFVLNEVSEPLNAAGKSAIAFKHRKDDYAFYNPAFIEHAVAMSEDTVRDIYDKAGLEADFRYGNWSGRKDHLSFQDVVLGRKRGAVV